MKKNLLWSLLFVVILALVSAAFCFPQFTNKQVIDPVNSKLPWVIPHLSEKPFSLGLDVKGGVRLEYKADLSTIPESQRAGVMTGVRDLIDRRINSFGVTEPQIQTSGEDRLVVELPGIESVQQAISWIGATPRLDFLEQRSEAETKELLDIMKQMEGKTPEEIAKIPNINKIFESDGSIKNPLFKPTELTGKYLKKATVVIDQTTSRPEVELKFDEEGAKIFEQVTERNIKKDLAIFLDGKSIIDTDGDGKITNADIYAPEVQQKISGGSAVINGSTLTYNEAKIIAKRLNEGALPVPLGQPISQQKIGPTLGAVSLEQIINAGILGFLIVAAFMVLYYRLPGLLASLALVFYGIVLLAIFKIFGVTLSLAAVGGFILSVGMAVDANVLIFSRMKEELDGGKNLSNSIDEGFNRAWPAIRDGNFTTIVVGVILYLFGTSFVKGFATTLNLGILLSMYSAIVVTRTFLRLFAASTIGKLSWIWKPLA